MSIRTAAPAASLAAFTLLAGCSDPASSPDAAGAADAPPAEIDASRVDASSPDAAGAGACGADQLCVQIHPVDGVGNLPAGRIAVAWIPPQGSGLVAVEVAYDAPWPGADVTGIDLAAITPPSAPYQSAIPGVCDGSLLSTAMVVLSTDPNGNGHISSSEILGGTANGIYGIEQELVVWLDVACAPAPPDFPEGLLAGVHVYTAAKPVMNLDGELTTMETCAPQTAGCDSLNSPF